MDRKIGFIGTGNMAEAMIGGLVQSGVVSKDRIVASGRNKEKNRHITEEYGITVLDSNVEVVKESDVIILAVKPNIYNIVINEIRDFTDNTKLIVSIAAGLELGQIEKMFEKRTRIIRTMLNTPALIREGISAVCEEENTCNEDLAEVVRIFGAFGEVEIIRESMMHAFIALSGSSPAYVYMFIEALADAGVQQGLKRESAYRMAAQAVAGAGKMVIKTGEHPGKLKDNVCSPGGTTIEAVLELENKGFRNAVISAARKCAEKSQNMLDK